ncbi:unnamed protein product [Blepharisma stoltei]|uniref:Protein kinase domain-containing protein n=1 Tax=Blepharisma stoltei TaxID=1481888 RepID=A0AAU9K0J0_9CILI|nr:unnamed protein product [Blepharisma stoltei]
MSTELLYPFLDPHLPSILDESIRKPFRDLQEEAKANESAKQYFFFLLFKRLEPLDAHQVLSVLELIKICKSKNPDLAFYVEDLARLVEKKFDLDYSSLVIENYEENKGPEVESIINNAKINYSEIFKAVKKWISVIEEMRNLKFDTKSLENYIVTNICDIDSSSSNFFDIADMIKDYEEINNCLHIEEQPILLATLLNGELRNKEHLELIKNSSSLANKEEMLEPYKKYDFDEARFRSSIRKVFDIYSDCIPELKSRIDKYKTYFPALIEIPQIDRSQSARQMHQPSPSIPQIERGQSAEELSQSSPLIPQINRNQQEEEKKSFADSSTDRLSNEFATTFEEIEPFDMNNLEIKSWEPLRETIDRIIPLTIKSEDVDFYVSRVRYYKPNGKVEEVVVKCHLGPNDFKLTRYKQEADIMAKAYSTGSSSFMKIYGAFYDMGNGKHRFTLVMEGCKESLKDEIKRMKSKGARYSEANVMKFLLDMLNAFKILIDLKIIHRDIKPSNIFVVDGNGENIYKIGDFDASLVSNRSINTTHSTRVGIVGTEIYMAPEIYKAWEDSRKRRKKEKDKRLEELSAALKERRTLADVFSLGLTVLEMLKLDPEDIQGLNCAEQEVINDEIDGIEGFDWLKPILKDMLTVDYHDRLSFGRLYEKYYDVLKSANPNTIID